MRIKTSGTSHILYRYSRSSDGKGIEAKIGAVHLATAPGDLSVDITDNLTPREFRELREHLAAEQASMFRYRFTSLMGELDSVSGLVSPENTDVDSVQKMASSLSGLQSAIRRVQRVQKAASEQSGQAGQAAPLSA